MKTQIIAVSLLIAVISLNGCSSSAPRITPGHLEASENVTTHTAKITNIIQLSEKEAPAGGIMLGDIAGMLIGSALTDGRSDIVQDIALNIGGEIGSEIVREQYGKTIYRLTLTLNNGNIKQIHVRGGAYVVGRHAKITLSKSSGNITSLLSLRT